MRIDWDMEAFRDIRYGRHDPAIIGLLEAEAQKIADAANSMGGSAVKYAVGSQPGVARPRGRHRASVVTANYAAIRDNAKNNSLIRVMGQR